MQGAVRVCDTRDGHCFPGWLSRLWVWDACLPFSLPTCPGRRPPCSAVQAMPSPAAQHELFRGLSSGGLCLCPGHAIPGRAFSHLFPWQPPSLSPIAPCFWEPEQARSVPELIAQEMTQGSQLPARGTRLRPGPHKRGKSRFLFSLVCSVLSRNPRAGPLDRASGADLCLAGSGVLLSPPKTETEAGAKGPGDCPASEEVWRGKAGGRHWRVNPGLGCQATESSPAGFASSLKKAQPRKQRRQRRMRPASQPGIVLGPGLIPGGGPVVPGIQTPGPDGGLQGMGLSPQQTGQG